MFPGSGRGPRPLPAGEGGQGRGEEAEGGEDVGVLQVKSSGRWEARIYHDMQQVYVGKFGSEEEGGWKQGAMGRARGQRSGEKPGPRAGTPPEAPPDAAVDLIYQVPEVVRVPEPRGRPTDNVSPFHWTGLPS